MKKIASFSINHDTLLPGMYISRTDGDTVTYDLRYKKPNSGDFLSNAALHTIEHLFATFVRNSEHADGVIYFGPMGCRTGFYFILRDFVTPQQAIKLTIEATEFIVGFGGEIPGATKAECGNYLEHDIMGAKKEAAAYLESIRGITEKDLKYPD